MPSQLRPTPAAALPEGTPTRFPLHIILPVAVALAVGVLLVLSARTAFEPAVPVEVRPAVFVRTPAPPPDGAPPSPGGDSPVAAPRGEVVQAPGWLEADPYYIGCTALADGVLETLHVLEGESVTAGQVVAELVREDAELALAGQEAIVAEMQARLASARADLAAATTDWEQPVDRERSIAATAAAVAEAQAALRQLPSEIESAEATAARYREELVRVREAFAGGAVTEIESIILEQRVKSEEANAEALRRKQAILEAKLARLVAEERAAVRGFELRVSERRMLDMAAAAVARAEAAVRHETVRRDEAALRLERMTIRAPIDGVVQRRMKVPGDKVMLHMDDPLSAQILLLYDPERLQVRVDVPLADASRLFVGQTCEVVVDVLPDAVFAGEVTRITYEADLQKNTLQVKVAVIDPAPILRPEMLTRVRFLPGSNSNRPEGAAGPTPPDGEATAAVRVPASSVSGTGSAALVWVVRDRRGDRGVAEPVTVTVDGIDDGWATVRGAIAPGDLVALAGADLERGTTVRMTAPSDAEDPS